MGQHLNRWAATDAPLRERLTMFWADHFTATGKTGVLRRGATPYVESAIRPNITGMFEDLLLAAILHPLMIHYLDQERSVGPNSAEAARGGKRKGLNENLAREVMELHTLGVDGPYTQTDVTQLAELLTGVTNARPMRIAFAKTWPSLGQRQCWAKPTAVTMPISAMCTLSCVIWPAIPPLPATSPKNLLCILSPTHPTPHWSQRLKRVFLRQVAI